MEKNNEKPTILVVDDIPSNVKGLVEIFQYEYTVLVATNGRDALEIAVSQAVDLIFMDVLMPEMDGFEVCEKLKANSLTRDIPVVFITANTDQENVSKGFELGAQYYLTKPLNVKTTKAIVSFIFSELKTLRQLRERIREVSVISTLCREGEFIFSTMEEAIGLSAFLSNACPDSEKAGTGLRELLFNAVEHGNLGITYEEKSRLVEVGEFDKEIDRRLALPGNEAKRVLVRYKHSESEIRFLIRDEGKGFDWKPYLAFDPVRAYDVHGRGIAMANSLSFESLEYQGVGNEVLAVIKIGT